ncbi:hypothetical protein C3L33_01223, partial [Rhododendron williamsianum]
FCTFSLSGRIHFYFGFDLVLYSQGHLDIELNDVGRKQAAAVAHRLSKGPKISVVYSSDLKRALDTAETIASSCGGLQVIKDLDLRERHLGDLQGLVYHEASKICPKAYGALSSHRTNQQIPGGGESLDQLYDRCTSALERIGSKHIDLLLPVQISFSSQTPNSQHHTSTSFSTTPPPVVLRLHLVLNDVSLGCGGISFSSQTPDTTPPLLRRL